MHATTLCIEVKKKDKKKKKRNPRHNELINQTIDGARMSDVTWDTDRLKFNQNKQSEEQQKWIETNPLTSL